LALKGEIMRIKIWGNGLYFCSRDCEVSFEEEYCHQCEDYAKGKCTLLSEPYYCYKADIGTTKEFIEKIRI